MPKGLKRQYGQGDLHFVTFCCYHHRCYLESVHAKNLFLKILAELRGKFGFHLVGYVIMPDHVHLLVSEPKKDNLSRVMQILKQRVSRRMRGNQRCRTTAQLSLNFDDAIAADRRF